MEDSSTEPSVARQILRLGVFAFFFTVTTAAAPAQEWRGFSFPVPTVGDTPYSLATDDFNGDGITDLVTANYNSHNVSVLLGNSDGFFSDQLQYNAGDFPGGVITGDFNEDGIPDIATANISGVGVLLGLGSDYPNRDFAPLAMYAAGDFPTGLTKGDFNDDGITDLVTANSRSDDISVLESIQEVFDLVDWGAASWT